MTSALARAAELRHDEAMRISHEVRYDASVEDVYTMLTDPAFRERASRAQGATSVDVKVDGGEVRITMVTPNTDIPAFARKIAGESVTVVQAESWSDDAYECDFSVSPQGLPARITGTRTLVEDGTGTLDVFEGEAHAKVPLVGGKLEGLLRDKLTHGWDTEHTLGVTWLASQR